MLLRQEIRISIYYTGQLLIGIILCRFRVQDSA